MLSWFRRDPAAARQKKLEAQIQKKYEAAVALQRNGRLREYGDAMKEIETLEAELDGLKAG